MVTIPNPANGKTLKQNPWNGTGFAKGALVLSDNVPWDSREQGPSALSSAQESQNERLASASRAAADACSGTRGKANMACRAKEVRQRLS